MTVNDDDPISKWAPEYIKQIRAADDERAMYLIKEFGELAYRRGWNAAINRVTELRVR